MKKRRTPTTRALMIRIWALALGAWLAAMSYVTVTVAQDIVTQNRDHLALYTPSFSNRGEDLTTARLGMLDLTTGLDIFGRSRTQLPLVQDPFSNMDTKKQADLGLAETYDTATVFLDASGQPLLTGGPYATVIYQDEATWFSGSEDASGQTYIDLSGTGYDYAPFIHADHFPAFLGTPTSISRYTGYFEGDRFILLAVHTFRAPELLYNPEHYTYGQLDREGRLDWAEQFDHTADTHRELVHLYIQSSQILPPHSLSVEANGTHYDTLEDLLHHQLQQDEDYESGSLLDSVMVRIGTYTDTEGRQCRYATAIHTRPIRTAMLRLLQFYVVTLIPVVVIVLAIWRSLRHQLRPLTQILRSAREGLSPLEAPSDPRWEEPHDLQQLYIQLQQRLRQLEAENKQLGTKLDYAENVEQHRRQLISGITHQLKTPLTVIHSYAEALCADIAADKREHYTQVIQAEVEQMDAMVLQMLDLSRLESGKVKLELGSFSLLRLTQSIHRELEILLQEKSLQLQYAPTEDFQIYADETRIRQVITELISNAIKYSPEASTIGIGIYRHNATTYFDIENPCPPLPQEELDKLWDSFYRGDTAHTNAGTGLGLTIVKAILTLHGGTCTAHTTPTGLKLRITLP